MGIDHEVQLDVLVSRNPKQISQISVAEMRQAAGIEFTRLLARLRAASCALLEKTLYRLCGDFRGSRAKD